MIFGVRKWPFVPTVLVLAAAAIMVSLGIWQLQRADWKGDLITRYSQAQTLSSEVPFPRSAAEAEDALYRASSLLCERVLEVRGTAGRSAAGQPGWAHIALCRLDGGGEAEVVLGWSHQPQAPEWGGGAATGFVAPAGEGARLVASPPQAGLERLARPDPSDLPNNHLAYAGQWFFFAITALVIYVLALRRRWSNPGDGDTGRP